MSATCGGISRGRPSHCLLIPCTLVWAIAAAAAFACAKPCCFRYRNWRNPCENASCENNALCVPALNADLYRCVCPSTCWNVGDSEDSGEVCGDDGRNYPSQCHLMRASCHAVYQVNVRYKGQCDPCSGVRCPPGQRCGLDAYRMPRCECQPCATGQTAQSSPVCGTDGRTYPDECTLNYESCYARLNISKLADGRCPFGVHCQAWCPHEYMECRVDPRTGRSACNCPAECPPVLSPVCGTDNETYDSECHLRRLACLMGRRGVRPDYRGRCEQPLWCLRQRPGGRCPHGGVCRVGIVETASPSSSVGGSAAAAVVAGPPSSWTVRANCERPECLEPLTLMWLPGAAAAAEEAESRRVCGTDGQTYKSACHLRQKAFDTRNASLAVAGNGSCNPCQGVTCPFYGVCTINVRGEPVCQCPNSCLYVNKPVCGTDGLTYTLECDLRSYACNNRLDIRVASRGSCPRQRRRRRLLKLPAATRRRSRTNN